MTPATLTTESLPVRQQFEAWRAWYASVFEMECRCPDHDGFLAITEAWTFDGFGLSRAVTPSLGITRSRALIRRNPVDHWCITVARSSTASHAANGNALEVSAAVPFIYSLGHEMHSERVRDRMQIYLSRDRFSALVPVLDAALGKAFDSPTGRLLADYLLTVVRNIPGLAAADGPRLATAIEAMVRACLAPSAVGRAQVGKHVDFAHKERVRRTVGKNLRSPSLDSDSVCRAVAISRSRLYRLLHDEGGVARYIQRRRLVEAYSILRDAANDLPIYKIAEMLCFADASSFTRAFRREFGMSPKDARAAQAGAACNPGSQGNSSFAEYLRNL